MTDLPLEPGPSNQKSGHDAGYRVLARKYRPSTFDELIGQEAMVRTLANAIAGGRLAHAFILTGVRGVGKTTTARLIARALNCVGPDGRGGPTVSPCGICDNCRAIAESRHVDILEMDAASRTGVDDIREIIEGVRYAPVSARYKVYIIDEVHMLSRNAFNALLKTLEEPPPHVKFIFATTEIRKVPVTVLSRCQRFDLKRVEATRLIDHFRAIATKENAEIEDAALGLIARAAEGSVRDGLSLLDQALAHGAGKVTETNVRDMLGLADRAQVFDLYRAVMAGDVRAALDMLQSQYNQGADPTVILEDMLEVTHWLTRLKVVPDAGEDVVTSESERKLGTEMAATLSMPNLTRSWQMLLKGLKEAREAPSPLAAAEMCLVRLIYAADLPDPADLVRHMNQGPSGSPSPGSAGSGSVRSGSPSSPLSNGPSAMTGVIAGTAVAGASSPVRQAETSALAGVATAPLAGSVAPQPQGLLSPQSFKALVALFEEQREPRLALHLSDHVHLVHFAAGQQGGRLELRLTPQAPADLPHKVADCLTRWTGQRWIISLSQEEGEPTLRARELAAEARARADALAHPLVQAALKTFPHAEITDIRGADDVDDDDQPDTHTARPLVADEEFGLGED